MTTQLYDPTRDPFKDFLGALAQARAERKQAKARISSHADKTKDMPGDGVMAFCTFYEPLDRLGPIAGDPFDRGLRGISGLTRLRFRSKAIGTAARSTLPDQFTITLYPNSAFFMPLSTNRLYTHEIVPSELDAARLPTRLGYVVRCSRTEAVHEGGRWRSPTATGASGRWTRPAGTPARCGWAWCSRTPG